MNLMGHYLDSVNLSAGSRRRKRQSWRGPVLALVVVGWLAWRAM